MFVSERESVGVRKKEREKAKRGRTCKKKKKSMRRNHLWQRYQEAPGVFWVFWWDLSKNCRPLVHKLRVPTAARGIRMQGRRDGGGRLDYFL